MHDSRRVYRRPNRAAARILKRIAAGRALLLRLSEPLTYFVASYVLCRLLRRFADLAQDIIDTGFRIAEQHRTVV